MNSSSHHLCRIADRAQGGSARQCTAVLEKFPIVNTTTPLRDNQYILEKFGHEKHKNYCIEREIGKDRFVSRLFMRIEAVMLHIYLAAC